MSHCSIAGEPTGVHLILATNREALANVLMALGKRDDARKYLDQADNELEAIRTAGREVGGRIPRRQTLLSRRFVRSPGRDGTCRGIERASQPDAPAVVDRAAVAVADARRPGDDHRRPGGPEPHDDPPPHP